MSETPLPSTTQASLSSSSPHSYCHRYHTIARQFPRPAEPDRPMTWDIGHRRSRPGAPPLVNHPLRKVLSPLVPYPAHTPSGQRHRELLRCRGAVALHLALVAVDEHDRALRGGLDHQPLGARWQLTTLHKLDTRDRRSTLERGRFHTPQMAWLAAVGDAASNPPDPAFTDCELPDALTAEVDGRDVVERQTLLGRAQGCDAQEYGPIADQRRAQAEPDARLAARVRNSHRTFDVHDAACALRFVAGDRVCGLFGSGNRRTEVTAQRTSDRPRLRVLEFDPRRVAACEAILPALARSDELGTQRITEDACDGDAVMLRILRTIALVVVQ